MEIKQNLTPNLTAANKNLEVLKAHFGHCFDKQGNFLMEKFQTELLAGEVNFSKESYGLEWLGRSYARLLASDAATTLLREDEAFNQKPENASSQNLLLKGDNLEILKHLSHAYFEKVKMIYIDPPYNTGGDGFVYQDDRTFTVKELQRLAGVSEEKAQRILEFTMSKSNSHSAWLTFMYPRLYIAKQLLRDDGVIFVSIDDNEVAQLRLLMDEIFGEENFVAAFPWRKRTAKSDVPYGVSQDFEWVLCFARPEFLAGVDVIRKYYYTDDFPNEGWRLSDLTKQTSADERPNSAFDMIDPKSKKIYKFNPNRAWSVTKETFKSYYENGKIVFPDDYEFLKINIPSYRVFEREDKAKALKKYGTTTAKKAVSTMLPLEVGRNEDGNKEIVALFGNKIFSFPKSINLISHFIKLATKGDDIILDFFAGSGTTGDAVMQLNAEDAGKRRFILAQLPETIDPNKNKASYDFVKNELGIEEPTIFEITKERLIRAAKKLREERPVEVAGQDLGFKVFETMPLWEDYHYKAETLEEDTPAPFRGDLLGPNDLQALFLTWKAHDGSPLTEAAVDYDLGGYVGKYVNGRLYLMQKGFTTDHLVTLLEKVEADADFNPRSVIVFESNFQSKNLRELAESLKNFQNQKSLEIDFIMRF
jgi:adenine-specific DNA-methyltransferase